MSRFRVASSQSRSRWGVAALVTVVASAAGIVLATPAAALDPPTFSTTSNVAFATAAWTASIGLGNAAGAALHANDTISVIFDSRFVIPATPIMTLGGGFSSCSVASTSSSNGVAMLVLGSGCSIPKKANGTVTVEVTNPVANTYPNSTFGVATSNEGQQPPGSGSTTITGASKVAFTTQPPSTGTAGAAMGIIRASIQDAGGATITGGSTATDHLRLSIASGPSSGTVLGTVQASGGVATFTGITLTTAGSYTLSAADTDRVGMTAATSGTITISPAAPTALAFSTVPPATGTAGVALTNFVVSVRDAYGNAITSGTGATDSIKLSVATGPGGISSGATTVTATAGVATFSGITFNTAGTYTLTATNQSHSGAITSGSIVISAALPSTVTFVQGPSDAYVGTAMAPGVTVRVNDQYGNATPGIAVTVAPSAGSIVAPGATASTDATGLATFGGITFSTTALGVTLSASTPNGASSGASAAFNVTVKVTTSAAALTDNPAPTDSGSGVKSVTYYYCAGWTGACTNGTQIGAPSTNPLNNYLVNWTIQPTNGDYRVVAVSTDNVDNASSASDSIPVRVLN